MTYPRSNIPLVPGGPHALFAALVFAGCIHSYAAAADGTTATTQPVVSLNPFEVKADSDRGFVATSSLAGGRLAGELKDTPVAYTVLTREFIDALELTDLT